jgi:hypothetical protein
LAPSDLPDQFWLLPEWDKFFKRQVAFAATILQDYPPECLVSAFSDKRLRKIRSFAAFLSLPFFQKVLRDHYLKMKAEGHVAIVELELSRTDVLPIKPKQINRLSRLKKLDGEGKT